jgi:hypothetical protein
MSELLEGLDFYERPTPYEVLGVSIDATAKDVRDRHVVLSRELLDKGGSTAEQAKQKEPLDKAYEQLRVAKERVKVDFFLLDSRLGRKQAEALAKALPKPDTNVTGMLKPKQVRVTHAALLAELREFYTEPERVEGLHPRPMDVSDSASLPDPLAVAFDC